MPRLIFRDNNFSLWPPQSPPSPSLPPSPVKPVENRTWKKFLNCCFILEGREREGKSEQLSNSWEQGREIDIFLPSVSSFSKTFPQLLFLCASPGTPKLDSIPRQVKCKISFQNSRTIYIIYHHLKDKIFPIQIFPIKNRNQEEENREEEEGTMREITFITESSMRKVDNPK